ncbi:MAG: hypothetical protein IPF59_08185 [Ignavibacteria bacterium]|nr:hypothetical protein [Ignavibacteria bacterium]MBK6420310.1 hypothetical protein [Ignavibacteria bacterium]
MATSLARWTTRIWFVIGVLVLAAGAYKGIAMLSMVVGSWWKSGSTSTIPSSRISVKVGEKVVTKGGATLAWQYLNLDRPMLIDGSPWLYFPLSPSRTKVPLTVSHEASEGAPVTELAGIGYGGHECANMLIATKKGEPIRLLIDRPGLVFVQSYHYGHGERTSSWPVLDVTLLLMDTDSSGEIDPRDGSSRWFFDLDGTNPVRIADSTERVHSVELIAPYIFVSKSTPKQGSNIAVEDVPSRLWRYDTRTREFSPMSGVNEMVGRAHRILLGE